MCKNVFGRKGKCAENVLAKSRTQESLFLFFLGLEVLEAFYSLDTNYGAAALVGPPPANGPGWG